MGPKILAAAVVAATCLGIAELGSYLILVSAARHNVAPRIFEVSDNSAIQGVGVKPDFRQRWRAPEFETEIATNNIGLREAEDYHGEPVDVGFYGDSFTFGHGVDHGERYSDRLRELLPDKRIVSFSYLNGWTTPHYLVFMRKYPEMLPEIGIVGLFLGNDLTSDMDETDLVRDEAGGLVAVRANNREVHRRGFLIARDQNRVTRLLRRSNFGELLIRAQVLGAIGLAPKPVRTVNARPPLSFERGQLTESNLAGLGFLLDMQRHLEARGRRLVVFLIPWSFYVADYPSRYEDAVELDLRSQQYLPRRIEAWCEENGVECINPVPAFQALERAGTRLYFEADAHWTPAGHAAAAREIHRHLAEGRERSVVGAD